MFYYSSVVFTITIFVGHTAVGTMCTKGSYNSINVYIYGPNGYGVLILGNTMGTMSQVCAFFTLSPKRQQKLTEMIEQESEQKVRKMVSLSQTRWVERFVFICIYM